MTKSVTREHRGFVYTKRALKESNQDLTLQKTLRTKTFQVPVRDDTFQVPIGDDRPDKPIKQQNTKTEKQERVSLGMRGKRVSESYNGMCPLPHPHVQPYQYHTLIDASLSEPLRMRQLLLWCALKTSETFPGLNQPGSTDRIVRTIPGQSNQPGSTDRIVRTIQKSIIKSLTTKSLNTSWYHRPEMIDDRVKEPNPYNIENYKKLEIFETLLKRYNQEIQEWTDILEYYKEDHAKHTQEEVLELQASDVVGFVDQSYLNFLDQVNESIRKVDDLIRSVNEESCKVHSIQHKIHQSRVTFDELDRDCDQLYSKMLRASAERDRQDKINPAQVLSLISQS